MENNVLEASQAQSVVDGLLNGYKEYLELRNQMDEKLEVSAGFAYTKGNFIDDSVARKTSSFVEYCKKKAGESWEYLEFCFGEDKKSLFIVKNDYRLQRTFSKDLKKPTSQYLSNYAKINAPRIAEIRKGRKKVPNVTIQLELLEDFSIPENELSDYDSFYIVVYRTSAEKVIESVKLVLPDIETRELHMIQDLTPYLQTSLIVIEEEEYAAITGEKEEVIEVYDYEYTVPQEEKEAIQ
ncbi:hypothetical protein SAMN02745116_00429 [Pilibacter termitis]|jgi:hypothetical protein|uniref:Uncharacterized protein n=1 Tax=Pilibacter termitis TaxID=263852 RepID=A0A1T4KWH7_9ENTE|nr:hypothetical protein [Pilibacter termitis]SJZ46708.1 hypothetical protein SAMN02745116_00429 [Pilibacter termitis]